MFLLVPFHSSRSCVSSRPWRGWGGQDPTQHGADAPCKAEFGRAFFISSNTVRCSTPSCHLMLFLCARRVVQRYRDNWTCGRKHRKPHFQILVFLRCNLSRLQRCCSSPSTLPETLRCLCVPCLAAGLRVLYPTAEQKRHLMWHGWQLWPRTRKELSLQVNLQMSAKPWWSLMGCR